MHTYELRLISALVACDPSRFVAFTVQPMAQEATGPERTVLGPLRWRCPPTSAAVRSAAAVAVVVGDSHAGSAAGHDDRFSHAKPTETRPY